MPALIFLFLQLWFFTPGLYAVIEESDQASNSKSFVQEEDNQKSNSQSFIQNDSSFEFSGEYYCFSSEELANVTKVVGKNKDVNTFYLINDLVRTTPLTFSNVEIRGVVTRRSGNVESKPIISGPISFHDSIIKDCSIVGKAVTNAKNPENPKT